MENDVQMTDLPLCWDAELVLSPQGITRRQTMKMMGPMDIGGGGDPASEVHSDYETANYGLGRPFTEGVRVRTHVLGAKTLMSHKVVDANGEDIGRIEEFMVDTKMGNISYGVLSRGGVMGMGGKLHAIPWKAFTVDGYGERLVLDVSKDVLDKAPGFPKDSWPDMTAEEFCSETYGYYGCQLPAPEGPVVPKSTAR